MTTTTNFGLQKLAVSVQQKHIVFNNNLREIEFLAHPQVIRADYTDPPSSPSAGDAYIPLTPATGAWVGMENKIAIYLKGEWRTLAPKTGWHVFNIALGERYFFDSLVWVLRDQFLLRPRFAAYRSSDQVILASNLTIVAFDTKRFDVESNFDTGTGIFTAPIAGYYRFGAGITYKLHTLVPDYLSLTLSTSGVDYQTRASSVVDGQSLGVGGLVYLDTSGTAQAEVLYQGQQGYVKANNNYFWGYMIEGFIA